MTFFQVSSMFSMLRRSALLLAAFGLAFECHAREFQNLDFEGTTFDFELLVDNHPYSIDAAYDIQTMIPGWSLRTESEEGEVWGARTNGTWGNFLLPNLDDSPWTLLGSTDPSIPPEWISTDGYQGEYFLYLQNGQRHEFTNVGLESFNLTNVAFQTGTVPTDAKSVLIQTSSWDLTYEQVEVTPENPWGEIEIAVPLFRMLFNGFEIDAQLVDIADYPDVNNPLPGDADPSRENAYWAANIESIAGLERELAVQPPSGINWQLNFNAISFDNILFSTTPTAGRPVRVPEPATAVMLAIACSWQALRPRRVRALKSAGRINPAQYGRIC
ncbi:hypothetical protein Pla123a_33210 [Posidoniimonas polymericola]|uniref:PEP-CTERM protein-sorting domain-containing protein n=1 Tax=Posidoniimonas polymericola TaxID=2528002 RepID=A0A5C5YH37_9BACT|nr:hypothetical protein [Posidoniimonas polymericola]TWT74498.1 hypothetical protein Pla123a_33210 [Posidoniimonas polymericola]